MDSPKWMQEHERSDRERFDAIHATLDIMKTNHLAHIEADMRWVKKLLLGLVMGLGGVLGSIVTAVLISSLHAQ